jgi:hypothetical protein
MARSIWVVVLAAITVRIVFITAYGLVFPEYWSQQGFGGWEIGWIAKNLYEGRGFSSPFSEGSQPTAWVSPMVPTIWAFIMRLMRGASGRTELAIVCLQAVVSGIAAGVYVAVFRRLAPNRPAWLEKIFPAAVVFWPESLFRVILLWYYVWQELSVAALVWFGIRWAEERTLQSAATLGLVGGLVALVNVSPIPLFALALGVPILVDRDRRMIRDACIAGLLSFLIVTPWLVRNRAVFGRFVLLRGNIGVELLQGNNSNGTIRQQATSLHPYNDETERARYRRLGEVDYNNDATRRARAWIRQHPTRAVVLIAQRIYVVWLTDITDRWSWDKRKWWQGKYSFVMQLTTILTALLTLSSAVFAVMRTGISAVPYPWLLLGVLIVPLPHYFTQVDDSYVAFLRMWLLLIAVVCFSAANSRCQSNGQSTGR